MIKKGSLIEVENISYEKNFRLKVFTRGYCMEDCEIGGQVSVKTLTGYIADGCVSRNNLLCPSLYKLRKDVKEIIQINRKL